MEFFKPGLTVDFLKYRSTFGMASLVLAIASFISIFVPGPNFGIDFKGGTELELEFGGTVTSGELRAAVSSLGYDKPDVIEVLGAPHRFIIRIQEVSSLPEKEQAHIEQGLKAALGATEIDEFKVSPGGDKISLRLSKQVDLPALEDALKGAGAKVRNVTAFGQKSDNRFEAMLVGVGDEVVRGLH